MPKIGAWYARVTLVQIYFCYFSSFQFMHDLITQGVEIRGNIQRALVYGISAEEESVPRPNKKYY